MIDIFYKKGLRVRVAALIKNSRGEILLIQQHKKQSHYWLLPGGGIEFGESAEEALKRELKEELNLEIRNVRFLLLNESIDPEGKRHLIQLVFGAEVKNAIPQISKKEKEITGFGYFPLASLKDMEIRPDIREYLLKGRYKNCSYYKSQWVQA